MYKYRITVFTPTYNRAYILEKLYHSLCIQSYLDFEWLIVDDGSIDGTEQLIYTWKAEKKINIRYFKIENGGKHRAINYGLYKAEGELFFTMDSDDELTSDALEKINLWFESIEDESNICGIAANRGTAANITPNRYFEASYLDKTWLETYSYYEKGENVLGGERAIIFYTDFHKKYQFPEFQGEKFLTEAIVYNRMAYDGFRIRFFNDIIWIYEYLDDGLTKAGNTLFLENPKGYGLWIIEKAKFENYSSFRLLKLIYSFVCELKVKYDSKIIAECIGVSPCLVKFLSVCNDIITWYKCNHNKFILNK